MFRKITLLIGMLGLGTAQALPHNHLQHQTQTPVTTNSLRLEVKPNYLLVAGKTCVIEFDLINTKNHQKLNFNDLKQVHTEKLHLLIIDTTLSDYHHVHPTINKKTGAFVVEFTPQRQGNYRVWADVTPLNTNQQEYIMTEIGIREHETPFINKTVSTRVTVNEYAFTLTLNGEAKAGQATMGTLTVTKNNKPFTALEPVMGAFAHIVGFSEDRKSVLHIHPIGKEPTKNSDRGGSQLKFHLESTTKGFVKLFAQVRIGGQDITIPFGIMVN